MTPARFPHSDISGSACACHSPKLFAACHVLHRLSAPRHPPSTLSNLTIKCLELMRSACLGLTLPPALTNRYFHGRTRPPSYSCYFLYSLILLSMISWSRRPALHSPYSKNTPQSSVPQRRMNEVVGLDRFELSTPRLSSVCSNQLSYRPAALVLSSTLLP